jgi:hypothetical protein
LTRPDDDHVALMEDLLRKIRVPVSAIRAYRGNELIDELIVKMRGSSLEDVNSARTVDKTQRAPNQMPGAGSCPTRSRPSRVRVAP